MPSSITVITGTYKKPDLLIPTIESILCSSYRDFCLYIVDDNTSEDEIIISETKKIIDNFGDSRINYVKNDTNIGVPFVFKKWIEIIKSQYFILMGAGDKLESYTLYEMINFLNNNPTASFVYGKEYFEDPVLGKREIVKAQLETGLYCPKEYLKYHLIGGKEVFGWSQSSAMYRTELFKYYNVPVKSFHFWDHYFHCTYLLHSKKVGYIDKYFAVRHVDSQLSEWATLNLFTDKVERLIQSLDFISNNEITLLHKKYPVSLFRYKISLKLIKSLVFCRNFDEFTLTLRTSMTNIVRLTFSLITFLFLFPFTSVIRKISIR